MAPARSLATVCTTDRWLRCGHQDTALDLAEGAVSLAWQQPAGAVWAGSGASDPPAWPSIPAAASTTATWRPGRCSGSPGGRATRSRCAVRSRRRSTCSPTRARRRSASSQAASSPPRPVLVPSSIAVDSDQHLYVLDGATGTIWVFDLDTRVAFRHVSLGSRGRRPGRRGPAVLVAVADREPAAAPARGAPRPGPGGGPARRARPASARTRSRPRSRATPPAGSGCCGGRRPATAGPYRPPTAAPSQAARPVRLGQRHRPRRRGRRGDRRPAR